MAAVRICQLLRDLAPAGPERCACELAWRLDRERFDVRVVAFRGGALADWLEHENIPVTVLGTRRKWDLLKVPVLTEFLRRERISLVHSHLFRADLAGRPAARLAAVPHVVHTAHTGEGRFRPWQFAYARFLSGYCDRIICPSEAAFQYHKARSGLPAHVYTVIPNGVDSAAFAGDDERRRELRGQWKIGADQVVAAYVGRLAPDKGIDVLLAAISHLGARGSPVDVVIAGDGKKRHLVENFIAHGEGGNRCRLLGFVDDVPGLLSAVDMLVMPSRWEGWPLAVGEAMAAGLPVIGTDVPGVRDLVVDGQTGALIERGNVVALSEAIIRLAGDAKLRARLGRAGRKRIREEFPIEATVAAHEKLYEDVVGA